MTRRIYRTLFAGVLVGFTLTGIACGGPKKEETSNAPIGKPPEGSPGPTAAGGAMSEGGANKVGNDGQSAGRK